MANDISYSSIAEIHSALLHREYSARELFDYIETNYNDWKSDAIQDRVLGSENDYHNLSVEFNRQNCTPFAAAVATIGCEFYPMSTDLLADVIRYSQLIGDAESCQHGLELLDRIDRKYWNWRTFTFVIDFLKDSLSSASSMEQFETNLTKAKQYIEDFKNYIPYDERSFVSEAELYGKQNKYTEMIQILEEGIKTVGVAPQCCMNLANAYLELGEYEKVYQYAQKGIIAATQEQPTISVGYLYYLSALAMDAIRIKAKQEGKSIDPNDIQNILISYQIADKLFINEGRMDVAYRSTIRAKLIILGMESGTFEISEKSQSVQSQKNSEDNITDFLKLLEALKNKKEN